MCRNVEITTANIAGFTTDAASVAKNARPGNGDDGSMMLSFLAEPRSRAGVVPHS